MSDSYSWAALARATIIEVKRQTGLNGDALRKELRQHYPFGERANWPYKAWLIEVDHACGISARKRKARPLPLFGYAS